MNESPLAAPAVRHCPRPAYKGKYNFWRALAALFFTAWMFTLGLALYFRSNPQGDVKVIYPSRTEQK